MNSRGQFKLSGLYQLPWGINITGAIERILNPGIFQFGIRVNF